MPERMIEANGVRLCTQPFGDPSDPAILLVMGLGGSMLWWEDGFCRLLADGGRFVIRYDHRDTGRSITYKPGKPGYVAADLVADMIGVLDAYQISRALVVGVSAGGGFAQLLALEFPDRVSGLALISTTPLTSRRRDLPGPSDNFQRFFATATVDWSDKRSVVDYLVGYSTMLEGTQRPHDKAHTRDLVQHDVQRAHDFSARRNHDLLAERESTKVALSSIAVPTLVIHGTADPMFPIAHGEALAEEIPGARLLRLEGAGHGVHRSDWQVIVTAILKQA